VPIHNSILHNDLQVSQHDTAPGTAIIHKLLLLPPLPLNNRIPKGSRRSTPRLHSVSRPVLWNRIGRNAAAATANGANWRAVRSRALNIPVHMPEKAIGKIFLVRSELCVTAAYGQWPIRVSHSDGLTETTAWPIIIIIIIIIRRRRGRDEFVTESTSWPIRYRPDTGEL
jgi:hypothetical protein